MPAMSQKRSLRAGVLGTLWLLAGVVFNMHAARQFTVPGVRGSSMRVHSSEAIPNTGVASGFADNERLDSELDRSSHENESGRQDSGFGKSIGALVTGVGALAVVGGVVCGGAAPSQATLSEGEEPIFNQWASTVKEGFTREQEDKNMGFFATNTRLFPISHNADLLNGSPQKIIQAGLPFVAMGAVSYYSTTGEYMQSKGKD